MKNKSEEKQIEGKILLTIKPTDPIAWKLLMLFEAANSNEKNIAQIANNFGYTREHFYKIKKKFEEHGSEALSNKEKGPKRNHKRTDEIEKQIIRYRFLDPEANSAVITQKLRQTGHIISQRSVERTINKYGLQKKGYIKQLKKQREKALKSKNKKQKETQKK